MAITRKRLSIIHRASGETIIISDSTGDRLKLKGKSEVKIPVSGVKSLSAIVTDTKKAFKISSSEGKSVLKRLLAKHVKDVVPLELYCRLRDQKLGNRLLPFLGLIQRGDKWIVALDSNCGSALKALKQSVSSDTLQVQKSMQVMPTIMEEVINLDLLGTLGKRKRTPVKKGEGQLNWEFYDKDVWIGEGGNTCRN